MLVCIDPGHALNTPGKRSLDGVLREYEFNRTVAKRIADHLQRHGIKTMYSCNLDDSADASLTIRCNAANIAKADVFISIHANAFGADWNSANGWEIYYSQGSTRGKALANAIHARSKILGLVDRGVKVGEFTVITKTTMPAVLIEHEFMTNRQAAERLKSAEWREKFAIADTKGILDYFGVIWKEEVVEEKKTHWGEKHLDSLVQKGIIDSPEIHRENLDAPITKAQIFAMIDRMTDK